LNPVVKQIPVLALVLFMAACAGQPDNLVVKQFVLRDHGDRPSEEPMIRMEKLRRLHGAVSDEERRQRLGQYFTLVWRDPEGAGSGGVVAVFEYQQGGSHVKKMTRAFPAGATDGVADFAVIGDDYFINGRVLAWRASVTRGGREIASRQSYLWR